MFRANQIIPASRMIRQFAEVSMELHEKPQALLITQKRREPLVLVNAFIFESLLAERLDRIAEQGYPHDIYPSEEQL